MLSIYKAWVLFPAPQKQTKQQPVQTSSWRSVSDSFLGTESRIAKCKTGGNSAIPLWNNVFAKKQKITNAYVQGYLGWYHL
jgi:hypothetical protein